MDALKKEIRGTSYRAILNEESRTIEGYAILFNTDSTPMWGGDLIERIDPSAMDGVLDKSDVLCLMNHDERRGVLARYREGSGSLSLIVDSKGLKYSFESPKTSLGDELIESLKRGDISESSFAFSVSDEKWEKKEDGTYIRTILKFDKIYDVSPVYYPVYEDTTVALRSIEKMRKEEEEKIKKEKEKLDQEERAKKEKTEIKNNLNHLKQKFL